MSVVSHGADVAALRAWAAQAAADGATLATTTARLDVAVASLAWSGPDQQRFAGEWTSRFAPALRSTSAALDAAVRAVTGEADEQERVSSDASPAAATTWTAADAAREAREAGWTRGAGRLLLGLLGGAVGGPVGSLVGAVAGPALVDRLVGVATDQARRTTVMDVTATIPITDTLPTGPGDLVHDMADLYDHEGAVRVDLVTRPDESQVALVYAPGTQDWSLDPDTASPMGSYGAVAAASGQDSPLRRVLLSAMDGIPEGVPIHVTTHSQSGFAALDLAADPYVRARHDIVSVLTTGTGGGQFEVPAGTQVVSVRNPFDPVARIGGTPDGAIDVTGSWSGEHPHSSREYAHLVARSDSPELAAWWRGVGIEPGSTVSTRVVQGVVRPGD